MTMKFRNNPFTLLTPTLIIFINNSITKHIVIISFISSNNYSDITLDKDKIIVFINIIKSNKLPK